MGYYSTFNYNIHNGTKINLKKAKELENYFKDYSNDIHGFAEVELVTQGDNELLSIELGDLC